MLLGVFICAFPQACWTARHAAVERRDASALTALRSRWALFGAAAIFLYVGAEVSIGSAMTNFLHQPDMLDVPLEGPGKMVSFYWGGAMVGRFIGSALLFLVNAAPLAAGDCARGAALLCLAVSAGAAADWPRRSSRCRSACSTRSCSR